MASRRILIASGETGAGHFTAAAAIAQAAQRAGAANLDAIVLDAFDAHALETVYTARLERQDGRWDSDVLPPPLSSIADRLIRLYAPIIVRAPWLWGWIYYATNNAVGPAIVSPLGANAVARRLAGAIAALRPDALVVVHPLLTHAADAARLRARRADDLPLITVITDLVSVHRLWVCSGVDHFVVGSPSAADALAELGVPPPRVHYLGVPIRHQFAALDAPARAMRSQLDLDPERPVVLLMGGGAGVGALRVAALELARRLPQAQLLVVTGRNVRLRRQLEARTYSGSMRVLGYVDSVAELMTAADIVVTKPGSLTIAEACARGRPLVLLPPIPGQEDGNVAYVLGAEAGLAVRRPAEAVEAVRYLLHSPEQCWEMGQRAARLAHPRAAQRTVDLVQGLVLAAEVRAI